MAGGDTHDSSASRQKLGELVNNEIVQLKSLGFNFSRGICTGKEVTTLKAIINTKFVSRLLALFQRP